MRQPHIEGYPRRAEVAAQHMRYGQQDIGLPGPPSQLLSGKHLKNLGANHWIPAFSASPKDIPGSIT